MLFKILGAIWEKKLKQVTAKPVHRTVTPLADLSQGSMIEINSVPLILAQGKGSLIHDIPGRHMVIGVGTLNVRLKLSEQGLDMFHVYLSQDPGSFLSITVSHFDEKKIMAMQLFQPYLEYIPQTTDEWDYWLKDDPDPQLGGILGCPNMMGKESDGSIMYKRSWIPTEFRIHPIPTSEFMADVEGVSRYLTHSMMLYHRDLDATTPEHLLVSAVETTEGASVNMWLGMDVDPSHLTIYPGT